MLLLVVVIAIPLAFVPKIQRARNQRHVVEMLEKFGLGFDAVWIAYDYQIKAGAKGQSDETRRYHDGYSRQKLLPPVPKWSLGFLGQDYFCEVVEVHFSHHETNAIGGWSYLIARIATLPEIRSLSLVTLDELTASDLAPLFFKMHNLETLELGWVTDKSLEQISKLERLESFSIVHPSYRNYRSAIQITDEGLPYIAKLTNLRSLQLGTRNFHPSSGWGCTMVSDEGLVNLYGLKNLEFLRINSTHITQAGIDKLQMALPNCEIEWNVSPAPTSPEK